MRRIGAGTGLFIQVVCRRTPKSHLNKLLWQKKKKISVFAKKKKKKKHHTGHELKREKFLTGLGERCRDINSPQK
jgi:hypothetical protein